MGWSAVTFFSSCSLTIWIIAHSTHLSKIVFRPLTIHLIFLDQTSDHWQFQSFVDVAFPGHADLLFDVEVTLTIPCSSYDHQVCFYYFNFYEHTMQNYLLSFNIKIFWHLLCGICLITNSNTMVVSCAVRRCLGSHSCYPNVE